MEEYIKKKDLLKAFPKAKANIFENCRNCTCLDSEQIEDIIKSIPVADVVERKRGKWFGEADGYADGELVYDMWSCPFCGMQFEEWDDEPTWNFCPNCGADMRET